MSLTATLRECHRLRKHLKNLQEEIDRGPRVLKIQQNRLAEEEQEYKDHFETIKKLKLKQRDDEGTLKQTETRLAKLEQQLVGISVQKEYDAKQSEIRQAREKKEALEDAILTTMGEVEEKTTAIPAVEKKWADAQAEFQQFQEEAKERLARLKADQAESQALLSKTEAAIPPKEKSTYDFLVKAHGPNALAAVRNKFCEGCRTSQTEQRMLELQAGVFRLCETCGKMLYIAE